MTFAPQSRAEHPGTAGMAVLVTGGLGYIGSHACVALAERGYVPVIIDNLSNSSRAVHPRLEQLVGREIAFIEGDVRDVDLLARIIRSHAIEAVMHFAGSKAVGESVELPIAYYDNNVSGTLSLVTAMQRAGIRRLIFSSSATVYSSDNPMPVAENGRLGASNPYGRSKLFVEHMLSDLCESDPQWSVACLRYFNPVGAHASALIGEDPKGIPNNLVPYIAQVAVGRRPRLSVFGDDYETTDGTGIRDYVHVLDVAEGHIAALEYLSRQTGLLVANLGTGRGVSVLEMVREYEIASGRPVPFVMSPRRAGDIAKVWADVSRARDLLGWSATRTVEQMCLDSWAWQAANPDGYA